MNFTPKAPANGANVHMTVPLFNVTDMAAAREFYIGGLGFQQKLAWTPDDSNAMRWCWLELEGVAVMLLFALSGSIGPFVGQNWGKGDLDRVHAGVRVAYQFSIAWGAFTWLVLMVIGDQIVPLIDKNPEVVSVARHYLAIVPISYGL